MAGEGYRVWTPGEVITADNIQQYLQDQAVQVYASAAARGSALTGYISEGMMSYLEDTNAVEVYTGSSWVGLGGDAPIFTQGTSGEFLKSLGTAGVEWDTVPVPADATPLVSGLVYGSMGTATGTNLSSITLGYNAGTAITGSFGQGKRNVVIGNDTAKTLTTGASNTLVGARAGDSLTTGSFNTAFGDGALFFITTATNNTGVGNSGGNAISGNNNVAVGAGAFGGLLVSGGSNTAIGFQSGAFSAMSGNNNTLIGASAQPSSDSVSNQITLGDSSVTSLRCNVTSISSLSDERDKTDIQDLPAGLEFIKNLRPVKFTWNTRIPDPITYPDGTVKEFTSADVRTGVDDMGFIAQDLVAAEDELDAHDWLQLTLRDNPERLEATQGRLIPILVKAIQELSAEVEALKAAK